MRASDGQNYKIINDVKNTTSDAFHKEITTFTDNNYPLEADTLYYKIMAVGEGTVSSKNVLFRNKNKAVLLTGNFKQAYYIEEENKLSVVSYNSYGYGGYQLKVFDLQSEQYLPNETSIYLSISNCWILWGHYNGKTECYNYAGNNSIYVYDAATTQQITTLNAPYSGYDPYATNHKGMIYIYSYYLYSINRVTETYTQYQPTNRMSWADFLYYDSKNNKLYAIDESNYGRIVTFNFNNDGSVANDEVFMINGNSGTPIFIENSSWLIVNTNGQFKILDMNTKMYYPLELTSISSYSSNLKAVLANNNIYLSDGANKIFQISTADYKISKTHILRTNLQEMFVANGYLYYLGQYDRSTTYLLDKIKL